MTPLRYVKFLRIYLRYKALCVCEFRVHLYKSGHKMCQNRDKLWHKIWTTRWCTKLWQWGKYVFRQNVHARVHKIVTQVVTSCAKVCIFVTISCDTHNLLWQVVTNSCRATNVTYEENTCFDKCLHRSRTWLVGKSCQIHVFTYNVCNCVRRHEVCT